MKCVKCHQEMDQELQFCPYCGRAVDSKWAFTSQLLIETRQKRSKVKSNKIWGIFKRKDMSHI
jgi:RNA polymerase subunit RPABC4/transcription elongation factor Spt4